MRDVGFADDGRAKIHVHVRELRRLFNSLDPSPFRERDRDPDCEKFIVAAGDIVRERLTIAGWVVFAIR
jgi:hypothetical protein